MVAAPIGIVGALGTIRDEIVAPENPELFKLARYLPEWRWQAYLLVIVGVLLLCVLESAYRLIAERNLIISGFTNRYSHTLALVKLIPSLDLANATNTFEIRLLLRSSAPAPLRFFVENYEYSIASEAHRTQLHPASIIPINGEITYFPGGGFSRQQFDSFPSRTVGAVRYSIIYGHPDIGFSRRLTERLRLEYIRQGQDITIHWLVRQQEDVEITNVHVPPLVVGND